MKRFSVFAAILSTALAITACAPTEYIISTMDGTMITTQGKPKLDEKTGMYTYRDSQGRDVSIKKEDVKQVMER